MTGAVIAEAQRPGGSSRPLEGRRICLVFDYSLSHYSRLLLEIEGLQRAGATISWLTRHPVADGPESVPRMFAPVETDSPIIGFASGSRLRRRVARLGDHTLRRVTKAIATHLPPRAGATGRQRTLRRLLSEVDAFWVIDFPALEEILNAVHGTTVRVIYETVDLVPEYRQHGTHYREQSLADERRLIGTVDGFITACESYADYYVETYGAAILKRRPIVRDNMPAVIVAEAVPTRSPLRMVFLGSLMFDRPVIELIDAVAGSTADVTLTIQGRNYLGENDARKLAQRLQDPELARRLRILDPCPPDEIVKTASAYDVGIVALRGVDENERRASTGKLFTYMAAGLAILGSDLPGIARVVRAHENGLLVQGMDDMGWANAMDQLASMPPSEIDKMKRRSLAAAQLYGWEKQEPEFVAEFARALSG